jgi:Condensation domain
LVTHHIASDGWSSGILWQELATLYAAFSRGEPDPLPELPIQYADYAVWQRQWLQGKVLETQLSYWTKQLSDASVLELPTDRPRPAFQSYRGSRESSVFTMALTDQLQALSRKEGVTLFMTLLAAFQTLLHRYSRQEDIVVGSPIAGRTRSEVEGLIGFFVNMLVLRTTLSGNPSFRELMARVREVALGAYDHQDLPFETLVEKLNPNRDLSHSPLFQVMFAHQNVPMEPFELPGLTVSPVETNNDTAKFDLSLYTRDETHRLKASLEYNTDLFDAATIKRMMGHFEVLLEGIVTNPEQRLSELPLLTEAEIRWATRGVAPLGPQSDREEIEL